MDLIIAFSLYYYDDSVIAFYSTKNGMLQIADIQLGQTGFVQKTANNNNNNLGVNQKGNVTITQNSSTDNNSNNSKLSTVTTNSNNIITNSTDQQQQQQQQQHQPILISYEDVNKSDKLELGRGATGTVYLIKIKDQKYALKVMPIRGTDDHSASVQQIVSEIKNLTVTIGCPYIIRFYEAFYVDHSIKIVLEYMDCGSMEYLYHKFGQFPEPVLSEISCQILKGLMYLKEKDIIHRDIKPSNILLNQKGEAKLGDFGLSKQTTDSVQHFNSYRGTWMYMSVCPYYYYYFFLLFIIYVDI